MMIDMFRASGLRGYKEVMQSLGGDPNFWLNRHHIPLQAIDNDDMLIMSKTAHLLLEESSQATKCGDLGLRIACYQDISILGPLGVVIQNESSVLNAIKAAERFLFFHSAELGFSILETSPLVDNAFVIAIEIRNQSLTPSRQALDLALGTTHRIAQLLKGENYGLKKVTLPHTPIAPLINYKHFFGTPFIITDYAYASLHIDKNILTSPLPKANPILKQITEDYLIKNFRVPDNNISYKVRLALQHILASPKANKNDVASMLAVHPRTLHRRLQQEDTTFDQIREQLRKDLTLQYLKNTKISVGQLSMLLGFSEQAAFARACQRWFGMSPTALRKQ